MLLCSFLRFNFFPQGPIQSHHTFLRICLILCAIFFYVQNKNISTNVSFGGSLWIHNKAWRNHLTFDLLLRNPLLIFIWINCSFWRLSDAHKRQTNMTYTYITNWYYNYTLPCQFGRIREKVLLKFRKSIIFLLIYNLYMLLHISMYSCFLYSTFKCSHFHASVKCAACKLHWKTGNKQYCPRRSTGQHCLYWKTTHGYKCS